MYSSYTAASFSRKGDLADKHGVNFEGALTWAFEFEDQPYFAGFRSLATNGIDKPILNVFRMFSKMSGRRLTAESDNAVPLATMLSEGVRNSPDVAAMASLDANTLSVMVWHYHDDDVAGPAANVELLLDGLPSNFGKANLRHFRIDESHSNAYSAWKRMGEPQNPTPDQYAELEKAGQLALLTPPEEIRCNQGSVSLRFELPRQAVSLLVIDRS
jgi:xylan 1,4-beta-xylosidase